MEEEEEEQEEKEKEEQEREEGVVDAMRVAFFDPGGCVFFGRVGEMVLLVEAIASSFVVLCGNLLGAPADSWCSLHSDHI